jgi:hypothetical protein
MAADLMTKINTFRRAKIKLYLKRHKTALALLIVFGLYALGRVVKFELASKGSEVLIEPLLEVVITRLLE